MADALVEEPERGIAGSCLPECCQLSRLARADDGDFADTGVGGGHHVGDHRHDTLGQRCGQLVRVERIVVLHHHATLLNLDAHLELRHIQLQHFPAYGLTTDTVVGNDTDLVGVGDGGEEAVVGSDADEGIVLVAQRLVEGVANLLQVFADRHVVDAEPEGQRVDKHTHGVGNLQVGTSTTDGTEEDVAAVGVTRHHIADGGQEQVGRRDLMLATESGGLVVVDRADGLTDKSRLVALGQVGGNLAGTLAILHPLGKELLGAAEGVAIGGLLLVAREIKIGVALLLDGVAVEQAAELVDEQVHGTAVEHQVVYVHQQVEAAVGLDRLETVKRRTAQIERLHKLVLILGELILRHLTHRHLGRHALVDGLHHLIAFSREIDAHLGMTAYELLDSLSHATGLYARWQRQHARDVIDGRGRILHALEVNARLCVREGNATQLRIEN